MARVTSNYLFGRIRTRGALALGLAAGALVAAMAGTGPTQMASARAPSTGEPAVSGGLATFRRLNEAQYRRSIEDIFGTGITVPGRFDPALREGGLLAIGDGKVAVSSSGFEQYELRARQIAAAVLAENRRKNYLSCAPQSPQAFDRPCAATFVGKYGRLLYRRPLTAAETMSVLAIADAATAKSGNFYKGLEIALSRMLASPNFIFRIEDSVADPTRPGGQRLDDYALATRISFLLWNAPPDSDLLDAAASGALRKPEGLAAQVDRLIASPRFAQGVRAFFSDMFAYDLFDGLSKEQTIYPKFTSQLAKDAQEQALRTIVDLLVTNKGDYRDLFTTKKTFINRNLGALYRVRVDGAGVDGWIPYTFSDSEPRAGLLTLASFLMLDPPHEGRSSPTIRGKSVRELLLCQTVPPPPPNVNQSIVQNTGDQIHKTARERLAVHATNPVCAGCHRVTDPIGLAMENYDAIGQFRTQENGAKIDTSGSLDGQAYTNAIDLGRVLHDSPSATSCVVQRAWEYGVGRPAGDGDQNWLAYAGQRFAEGRYAVPALMRFIATSKAFQAVSAARPPAAKMASN